MEKRLNYFVKYFIFSWAMGIVNLIFIVLNMLVCFDLVKNAEKLGSMY